MGQVCREDYQKIAAWQRELDRKDKALVESAVSLLVTPQPMPEPLRLLHQCANILHSAAITKSGPVRGTL